MSSLAAPLSSQTTGAAPGPVQAAERIALIDVLRGAAILGIFGVNMQAFNAPLALPQVDPGHWTSLPDRVAEFLIVWLAQGKFYTLFSFLFGLGLALQMGRVEARGGRFAPLYVRRLLALFGIGLAHAFLIWMGDILVTYAVLGFALLALRRRPERTLAVVFAVCVLVPIVLGGAGVLAERMGWHQFNAQELEAEMRQTVEESFRVYPQGSLSEIMARRAKDVLTIYATIPLFGTHILAMFALGLWAGRRRILENPGAHAPLLRRVRAWGFGVGLPLSLIVALLFKKVNPVIPTPAGVTLTACWLAGGTALSMAYASAVSLLYLQPQWRRRLEVLAPVGCTALSNYLLQSIVSTLIFYSYGLGLYGKVGPAAGLVLTIAIYVLQIPLSAWWLKRFRFGPAEWLWRSITYGRLQPMRA